MRRMLLALAESERYRNAITNFPPTRRLAQRFVAGETLSEAIEEIKKLNIQGIEATLDHLGENTRSKEESEQSADVYLDILDRIVENGVSSHVSLKPTQMGLAIDKELCFQNVKRIAERAARYKNFVRIDMESSEYVDSTLELYKRLRTEGYANVGIVVQSYLYRTAADLKELRDPHNLYGLNVRICKGAYSESEIIAFPLKQDVDQNYIDIIKQLWSDTEGTAYVAVATHDEKIIAETKELIKAYKISNDQFEFQMLFGIRRDLQKSLANEGYKVRVYVSYGKEWYPYFMRRLAERPANLLFILRNLFRK